LTQDILYDII